MIVLMQTGTRLTSLMACQSPSILLETAELYKHPPSPCGGFGECIGAPYVCDLFAFVLEFPLFYPSIEESDQNNPPQDWIG